MASAEFSNEGQRAVDGGSADGSNAVWNAFAAAQTPEQLCQAWLTLLAGEVEQIVAGIVLLRNQSDGAYVPAAVWPDPITDVTYLTHAAQQALTERRGTLLGPQELREVAPGSPAGVAHIALPIETGNDLQGVTVLAVKAAGADVLSTARRRLFWASAWLTNLFLRDRVERTGAAVARSALALDVAMVALEKPHLQEAALALVNALAVRLGLTRASLGFLEKDEIRVKAVSHAAHFAKQSEFMQETARAMEEALDQVRTLHYPEAIFPGRDPPTLAITTAHRDLVEQRRIGSIISCVLYARGEPFGVLTFERPADRPLDEEDVLLGEAIAGLLAPVLADKRELDRWFAGKLMRQFRRGREVLLGPYHLSYKLAAVAAGIAVAFLSFAQGDFRVPARAVLEGATQRAAVAPFKGFIGESQVRAGDRVQGGQLLATLDDKDLALERIRWTSERDQTLRKLRGARAENDRPAIAILEAQLEQTEAQLTLVEAKLERTRIRAPFDGLVVSGDLSQVLGAPVEEGQVLFEIVTLDKYRLAMKVDERDIGYVVQGQKGKVALAGMANEPLNFTVSKLTAVSSAEEGSNVFRAEALLETTPPGLRPGMEGVAKVNIGERKLAWIWTRTLANWLRIKLWKWLP